MLDLGGSSGWVWALFKVEPRVMLVGWMQKEQAKGGTPGF